LLETVHDGVVWPTNDSILVPMKDYYTRKMGRQKAQKMAEKAAANTISKLTPMVAELTHRINDINRELRNNL
jgi:hypothetical protein